MIRIDIYNGFVEGANEASKTEADKLRFLIEKNGGYTCQTDHAIRIPGTEVMNNIHNSINRYDRIIILITDQSASKGWFTFAVLSALENIIVENHMRLLVAYKGNRREDVGFLKTGLLSLTPKTCVDLTEWQGYERLLKQLKTPVCLDEELPAGNLHLGLVHSHISGYMCYVAEERVVRLCPGTNYDNCNIKSCKAAPWENKCRSRAPAFLSIIPADNRCERMG
ncbi:uncharacterized protein LOC127870284 isoform X2 [Dreissena polymorpha]|uniref:uncharacterized protein LOC127870284 isoform X2 n=1 Tax=Dreissena polymorpha TaxID=45954 RepID=UPI002263C2F4|nr:uncharacterized protein LOC127870284 isoform X2 [Dreissena polymorpha]